MNDSSARVTITHLRWNLMLISNQQRFRHFRVAAKYTIDGFRGAEARATERRSLSALGLRRAFVAREPLRGNSRDKRDHGAANR